MEGNHGTFLSTHNFFILFTCFVTLLGAFLFARFVFSADNPIVITEICPTGCASKDHQWIEIYNKSDESIDIANWKFVEHDTDHGLQVSVSSTLQSSVLAAKSYAIITQNDVTFFADYPDIDVLVLDSSWGTLNKSGEIISLKNSEGDVIEEFAYNAIEYNSLERVDVAVEAIGANNWKEHPEGNSVGTKNYWHVTEFVQDEVVVIEPIAPTPIITAPDHIYIGEPVLFSAVSSTDDGKIVLYKWDIEHIIYSDIEVSHTFSATGTIPIFLTITDNELVSSTINIDVEVFDTFVEDIIESVVPTTTPSSTSTSTPEVDILETSIDEIVINEFVSDPVAETDEWIELYNVSTSSSRLDNLAVYDGAGKLKDLSGQLDAHSFVQIFLTSSKLNNNGDAIFLKHGDNIIDVVRYGDWVDDNDDTLEDNAPAPQKGESSARIADGQDSNNDKNDFARTTQPTPSETNVIVSPVVVTEEPDVPTSEGSQTSTPTQTHNNSFEKGSVVINELVSDPADDMDEFVEVYNTTDSSIPLDGWYIEDGSEARTMMSGSIASHTFFVVEKPKGNLNNSGDIVVLFDPTGTEIDRVTYGTWDDGNTSDNAAAAEDPYSLIRKVDGQDADNDVHDFVITKTITKGSRNIFTPLASEQNKSDSSFSSAQTIRITEVFPNPVGSDSEDEFVEVYNYGEQTIDLIGWSIGDASAKRHRIKSGRIAANSYFVFKRSLTGIALNNTGGDAVKLFDPNEQLVDSMTYPGSAPEAQSYVRTDDGSWQWTIDVTPGKKNSIAGTHAAPIISIDTETEVAVHDWLVFDASDTIDPDGDEMIFTWDFGDGVSDDGMVVEHKFAEEGVYTVTLVVSDGKEESQKEVAVTVKMSSDFVGGYAGGSDVSRIRISEILPNPSGSDTTEFVELFNPSDTDIDISGIKLDDEEGGSRAYTIPEGTIVLAGQYKIFGRQETKLALNNTSDSVRLLYPDGTPITEVRYDDVVEAASYVQDDEGMWVWSSAQTPGEKNIVSAPQEVKGSKIVKKSRRASAIISTTLARVRNEDIGDRVKLVGTVTVEPGVLGTQFFYIGEETMSTSTTGGGIQVYMYSKDFPILARGDIVEVTGEITESGEETRIKLKEQTDIVVVGHGALPKARTIDIASVGEAYEGQLAAVDGEVTEIKGSYMYVDDGSAEVKVYFKRGAGIEKHIFNEGDLVQVRGIVHQTKQEYQILPRDTFDIQKTGVVETQIRPEEVVEEQKDSAMQNYVTATAGGLTAIFVGLFVKNNENKIRSFLKSIVVWIRKKYMGE